MSKGVVPARTCATTPRALTFAGRSAAYLIATTDVNDVHDVGSTRNGRVMSPTIQIRVPDFAKVQNKIVAAAAWIGFTGRFKPVIRRKAHCSRIRSGSREKILILGKTE